MTIPIGDQLYYLFKGNELKYRRKKQNSISSLLPQVCSNTNPTA
jgi:hypothetical protein